MVKYQLEMECDGRFSSEQFGGHVTPISLTTESGCSAGSATFYDIATFRMESLPRFSNFFKDLEVYVFIREEK